MSRRRRKAKGANQACTPSEPAGAPPACTSNQPAGPPPGCKRKKKKCKDVYDMKALAEELPKGKPPTINLQPGCNISEITKSIIVPAVGDTFYLKCRRHGTSIHSSSTEVYWKIIRVFQNRGIEYYTYQFKEQKPFRVIIRHLDPSTPIQLIKKELKKLGFTLLYAYNLKERVTKIPLPFFFINLKPAPNNKDILNLKSLLCTEIEVEERKGKVDIPQCHRCQGLCHTRRYCQRQAACVKCAGEHLSQECTKPRDAPATCANCRESHTANFRGCPKYKEVQALLSRQPASSLLSQTAPLLMHLV